MKVGTVSPCYERIPLGFLKLVLVQWLNSEVRKAGRGHRPAAARPLRRHVGLDSCRVPYGAARPLARVPSFSPTIVSDSAKAKGNEGGELGSGDEGRGAHPSIHPAIP